MSKKWTDEEKRVVREMYPDHSAREIAQMLGKTASGVWQQAQSMGVRASKERIAEAGRRLARNPNSMAARFKKGHVPDCKGKKMPPETYEKIRRTMFAKGHIPSNRKPVGSERVNVEGYVDGVRTIIDVVRGQFAMGWIIRGDLTLEKCWIARVGDSFAHGKNIHEAHVAALDKAMERMPEEKRIDQFVKTHPSMEVKYSGEDLFKWHHILTGSCEMGRRAFCQDRGIDVVTSSYTVEEFIRLTCASYGSDIIRKLADRLSIMI